MNLTENPFDLLELEPCFLLDLEHLQNKYRQLQKKYHPDRLTQASLAEQRQAQLRSTQINAAYQILKDPWKRVHILLYLAHFSLESQPANKSLLNEIFDAQEAYENTTDESQKAHIKQTYALKTQALDEALNELFLQIDNRFISLTQAAEQALLLIHQRKYYYNMAFHLL